MPKTLCYVGDPCHAMPGPMWGAMLRDKLVYENAAIEGEQFFMRETYGGDGEYELLDGEGKAVHTLPVDSGTLAAIPLHILPQYHRDVYKEEMGRESLYGAVVEIDLVNCSEEDGKFTFDHYTVDTNPPEEVPEAITVHYTFSEQYTVKWLEERLEIKWKDIETWWIKHDQFRAELKDGSQVACDLDSANGNVDWKWPELIRVYNKDHVCIEERD